MNKFQTFKIFSQVDFKTCLVKNKMKSQQECIEFST